MNEISKTKIRNYLHITNIQYNDKVYQVAMFVMPFAIINDITGEWPLGERACKIWIR